MAANGPGASKFAVGQRVVGAPWPVEAGNGTWQQYMVVPESCLVCLFLCLFLVLGSAAAA